MAPSPAEGAANLHHEDEQGEECSENSPLLSSAGPAAATEQQQQAPVAEQQQQQQLPTKADALATLAPAPIKADQQGQCRICLEEDSISNLEAPCGCTGTQQYTHKDCLQKWINEKHNNQCEICQKQYEGDYTVPPPPPQPAGEQLSLAPPLGSLYLTVEDSRVPEHQLLSDVYDDWDDHRQPTVSWCFSFMMFLLFMLFLHSSMTITVPDTSSTVGPGGPGSIPGASPAIDPSGGSSGPGGSPMPAGGAAAAGFAAGASLFFLWLLTKLFLVVLPLLMVMRLAARAQEQAAEAAAAAAIGTMPGLDSPVVATASTNSPTSMRQLIAQLAGRNNVSGAGSNTASPASIADLEMEVRQARRAALSRLGRDTTFFAPAAPGAAAAPDGAGSSTQQQQQQEEQRMIAAMRAMVRAAILNTQREMMERRSRQASADAVAPARLNGVV